MLFSRGDGYLGKLLEFPKACQVPFRVPIGNVDFLWKCCSVKGPVLFLSCSDVGLRVCVLFQMKAENQLTTRREF